MQPASPRRVARVARVQTLWIRHDVWATYLRVLTQVSVVCCGWSHSMCIDEHGVLLTWGRGEAGCLGHGDSGDRHLPTPVDALPSRAALIAAGCAQYNTLQHSTACRNVQAPLQRTDCTAS